LELRRENQALPSSSGSLDVFAKGDLAEFGGKKFVSGIVRIAPQRKIAGVRRNKLRDVASAAFFSIDQQTQTRSFLHHRNFVPVLQFDRHTFGAVASAHFKTRKKSSFLDGNAQRVVRRSSPGAKHLA